MYPAYYGLRRLNPYRGVVQIVEAGDAAAHSHDGVTWHLRADDGYGWVRPSGIWVEGEGLRAGPERTNTEIVAALETRPALPFRLADSLEFWLLDKAEGKPLALLASTRPSRPWEGSLEELQWHPFVLSFSGFRSPTLEQQGLRGREHRDALARLVNSAARPMPAAQWFKRAADGSGAGLHGVRLVPEWGGRRLPADAFPELLVRTPDNNLLEQSVISDYHAWLAPLLLLLPELCDTTRRALEAEAVRRPAWLYRVHRLLPKILDAQRLQAALVAARLEAANPDSTGSEGSPEDLF